MKKIFSFLAAGLLLASCSNDDFSGVQGQEEEVAFSFALPETVNSRAIGGSNSANGGVTNCEKAAVTFTVQISYGSNVVFTQSKVVNATSVVFRPTLVVGENYNVVAYAQLDGEVDLTAAITENGGINDESQDAYYLSEVMVAEPKMTGTLTRHTGKLRLIANDFQTAMDQLQKEVVDVKVVYNQAQPTSFDAAAGTWAAAEGSNKVFNAAMAEYTNEIGGDAKTLFVDYIPADATGHVVNFEVVVTFNDGTTFAREIKMDVPIKRNWLTTLKGDFFTEEMELTLTIDPVFENETVLDGEEKSDIYGSVTGKFYATLSDALAGGETDIKLADGEYTLPMDITGKTVTITGASANTKINLVTMGVGEANITFENLTFVSTNANYSGLQHAGEITFNDCVIENQYWCYSGEQKTTFNNCTFNQTDAEIYNVWTYGSNVDFNDCVFNCAGKSVLVYTEGGDVWETVNFNGCEFIASAPVEGKAAIEIDSSLNPCNVNIENCTATGFALGSVSKNSLWNLKKGEEGVNCNITVVVAEGVTIKNSVYNLSNAAGMTWFANEVNANGNTFAGKTVALANDINLSAVAWTPVGANADAANKFQGTFDGQGYTIKNLKVEQGAAYHAAGFFGALNGTAKNFTIDGAAIVSISTGDQTSNGTAVVAGSIYNTGLIEGVIVKNATVNGNRYVAGIAGFVCGSIKNCVVEESTFTSACDDLKGSWDNGDKAGAIAGYFPTNASTIIDGCSVKNVTVKAYRDFGGIAGAAAEAKVTNCTTEGVTLVIDNTQNYKGYTTDAEHNVGEIVGRKL